MGVAYYGNYLTWFEVGRTDLLRQLGASYREIESRDVFLPVVEVHCKYHQSARYDDVIEIHTSASRPTRARLGFDYRLVRAEDEIVLATGSTHHVATNAEGRVRRLPQTIVELFE